MEFLILTLTINPAIDRNVTVDRLIFEDRAYILSTSESAGGRGINAALVIHSFGGKALAIMTSGGKCGALFEELVRAYGFPVEVVPIRNEIRTNLASAMETLEIAMDRKLFNQILAAADTLDEDLRLGKLHSLEDAFAED